MDLPLPSLVIGFVAGVIVTLMLKRVAAPSEPVAPPPPLTGDLETDVRQLLGAKRKIDAIKLVRTRIGCGLKEAKEQVEVLERQLRT